MIQFSESHALVTAALLAVQREVQPVVKDRANPLLHSKYATLDAITDYVRPLLAKNELTLLQSVSLSDKATICVESVLLHVSGEWIKNTVPVPMGEGNKGTSPQQVAGSTITYGRRYGLSALLALTTDEDDDGNGRGQTAQRRAAKSASRGLVDATNGVKAVTHGDIPFPALRGLEEHKDKPLRDVPTEALETCYQRAKDRPEKKVRALAESVAQVLEERRLNDFTQPHPALADD